MERLSIDVVENATETVNIMAEAPLDKVIAACMTDYLEYRNAEEQGLLLRLPCKVGDEVYCIKSVIDGCEICSNRVISYQTAPKEVGGILARGYMGVALGIVGKNVFATKEEAEQALKQMGV